MSEPFDPLEDELRALAPQEPSPELKERIAAGLALMETVQRGWLPSAKKNAVRVVFTGGLIAAALALAFLLSRDAEHEGERNTAAAPLEPAVASAFDEALPTLWQFHSALRSPNELDALLDKHAGLAGDAGSPLTPIRGFGRSETTINTILGEL